MEKARLYKAANERCYGFQFATKTIGEGLTAAQMAADAGATWVDINCGCPIFGKVALMSDEACIHILKR